MTKALAIVVFLYYSLYLALWSIICLTPSFLVSCSVVGCCSAYPLLVLFSLKELCLSEDLGSLQPLLSSACLHCTLG